MGSQTNWELELEEDKESNNAILKVINENIKADMEKKGSRAEIYGTPECELSRAKNSDVEIQQNGCTNKKS